MYVKSHNEIINISPHHYFMYHLLHNKQCTEKNMAAMEMLLWLGMIFLCERVCMYCSRTACFL